MGAMTLTLPDFLTREQREIITADHEHVLITAVAGSGKTTTLAWRLRWLLEQGHDPRRMLVLMFNRNARLDFERKLRDITRDTGLVLPEIRTYHSMGLRLYRRFVQEGYLNAFSETLLTDQVIHYQVWQLIRRLVPEELAEEARRNKKDFVETATGFIDLAKTTLSPVEVVFEALGYSDRHRYLIDLFHSFEQWRKRRGQISYADMLYEPVMAIHQNAALQRLVANKMDLILVDEYQDTNEIQHLLLRYIAGDRARVTVVGDPDQTIYEFRGARPEFILTRFREEFDEPLQQTLSYSFRYGHRLALLANHLITRNQGRHDVLSHAHPSTPPTQVRLHRSESEAAVIVSLLEPLSPEERRQTALLFRIWSQSLPIELQLLARQIPYRIDAGKGALFSREVSAVTGLLQLLTGQLARLAEADRKEIARQLLRFPHVGLKESELEPLAAFLARFEEDWHQRLLALDFDALPPMAARKLRRLGETLALLGNAEGTAASLVQRYAENTELFEGIRSLALTHDQGNERVDTIQGFCRYLASLDVGPAEALEHLAQLRQQASQSGREGVLLSTIHRTKGLEWSRVILPGLQEKYLPYRPRKQDDLAAFVESERRLLYVAMTRARDELHLIAPPAGTRAVLEADQGPSRFISELSFSLSDTFGQWLDEHEGALPEAGLTLDQPVTPVSRRYADRHGVRLEGTGEEATLDDGPLWSNRRLSHAIFGPGSVRVEDESSFAVAFDKGDTLNFSKQSAHLYFRPLKEG